MRLTTRAVLCGSLAALLVAAPALSSTNDPYLDRQWGFARVDAEAAWAVTKGAGAIVAVVDSGVDLGHPDLDGNLIVDPTADLVAPQGTCKKEPGKNGVRVCTQDGPQDENGHGTHVAGIIAAEANNGTGVAGIAPEAKVLPVRVLDADGSGDAQGLADGIRFAVDRGADVINMSLGWMAGQGEAIKILGVLDPVYDALEYASSRGVVVVVAAGNDSAPLCAEPAAAPGVVCVGASSTLDTRSYYSSGDATMTKHYLVGPGGDGLFCSGDVFSTYLRSRSTVCSDEAGYEAIAGSSMAAPHVSGVAALLAAKGLSAGAIVACLLGTAEDLGPPGADPLYGSGLVDASAAVRSC